MDAKEIKSTLKSAREAIKNEDYKSALQLCKSVLKSDRNNYIGLVIFGLALQHSEQKSETPKAYKKAIEVSPEQITAWQGLASYYEKEEDSETNQKELLPVYDKLLSLESDVGKFMETCNKLAVLSLKLSKVQECVDILTEKIQSRSPELQTVIWKTVASVLTQEKNLSSKLSEVLENALETIIKDCSENIEEYFKSYLRVLYKNKKNLQLLDEARKMLLLYPESESALYWICKVYSEQIALDVKVSDGIEDGIQEYYNKLAVLKSESSMVLLAKSAEMFREKNFIESCDILKQVVRTLPQSCHVWALLSRCYLNTHCYEEAETSVKEALNIVSKLNVEDYVQTFLLSLLVRSLSLQQDQEKLKEAVTKCTQILSKDPDNVCVVECLARAHIVLDNHVEGKKFIGKLKQAGRSTALLNLLLLKKERKLKEALELVEAAVLEEPSSSELWLELGKLHWEEQRYSLSLPAFLKATKLDPNCSACYVYLGDYYRLGSKDADKARRCYQKAFRLNPNCKEAGAALSDVYRLQKNSEANIQLLMYVTETVGPREAGWAWLRLGLHHIEQGNYQEAINSLLAAVRADPTDSHCWESLGDAYYGRGSYQAALKSYQRVLDLNPEAVYPAFQMGTIKQLVGLYVESIEEFKSLLSKHPKYVPALKGLGETYLCIARTNFSQQLLGCCMDSCQKSLDELTRAADERKDLSCVWKLLGDICTLACQLPETYAVLHVKVWITNTSNVEEDKSEVVALNKENIFLQGIRCYCRALSLRSTDSLIWQDLAYIYHLQADYMASSDAKLQLQNHALAAVKRSIALDPKNWQHWNLLGVIAASTELKKMELAQHAFIKSIQLENNVLTWSNLGTLYLCLDEIKLAHEAFKMAQMTEPSYVESWIGQALIAEGMRHEDTMDLFRHTTQLGVHTESCVGYSHWVCSTLKTAADRTDPNYVYSIEKMFAVPVAGDSMTWYTGHIKVNPCAYNMLGMLMERQQQHHTAAVAYKSALDLLETSENVKLTDMVRCNYGRVLVQLQQFEEAVSQYLQVKEADFITQCALAVAYFKAKKYEDSYSTYGTALEWLAPTDGLKSHVIVAMAAVAYMCQGVEESKTLLFECIKLKPPSVLGLFALCSLGMLHSDLTLTELVLKELAPNRDNLEYTTDIAVFKAYTHFLQGHSIEAVRALSSTVHRHPGHASLWHALSLLLLHMYSEFKPSGAARCAQVAMALGRSTMDVSKMMSLVSLSYLLSGKSTESLRSSQKAVHMFPDISENWVVLIASFMPLCVHRQSSSDAVWLKKLISHVRRKLEASRQMSQWLSHHERKVTILAEEYKKP